MSYIMSQLRNQRYLQQSCLGLCRESELGDLVLCRGIKREYNEDEVRRDAVTQCANSYQSKA